MNVLGVRSISGYGMGLWPVMTRFEYSSALTFQSYAPSVWCCWVWGLFIIGGVVGVGGVWVFRTVCFERVVLSSPGCLWPGRMDDHEEVLEAYA